MTIQLDRETDQRLLLRASRSEVHSAGGHLALAPPAQPASEFEERVAPLFPPSGLPSAELESAPSILQESPSPLDDIESAAPRKTGPSSKRRFLPVFGLLALASTASAAYLYWDHDAHFASTDDAFIAARQFSIAPKVSGYLSAVSVSDNQHVESGDVIAKIDDRDYQVALAQAEAQVQASDFGVRNVDSQTVSQQFQISANEALVKQQQAALTFAEQQAARAQDLLQKGAGSLQNAQQSSSQLEQARAAVESALASRNVSQRQLDVLKALRGNVKGTLAQAEAQREQAQLNLSYTFIAAAQPGRIVNLSAAVGQYVTAGTAIATLVPDEIWVTANFKETQLDRMRSGQFVSITVDAYPERILRGHVASVQPGSGTAFSLLPAENATGNYVKIVQRVPVKIVLDDAPADVAVGPGMSVVPTVRIDAAPSLYERLKDWASELLRRRA
jgi:membrane fusion protein, multidrug efflux system